VVRALSLGLGFSLCVSVGLPWFELPLLGWSVPTPAWNALGLGLLALGNLHVLRALNMPGMSWGIRLLLPWVIYRWWGSQQQFRDWGKATLAPVQLKLSGVNDTLSTLGLDGVSIYDPVLWRDVQPGWGYTVAGASLLMAILVTAIDQPPRTRCPSCRAVISPEDPCCHGCGKSFPEIPGCRQCGRPPQKNDRFCRSCGTAALVAEDAL
jgi:hypothetical protein